MAHLIPLLAGFLAAALLAAGAGMLVVADRGFASRLASRAGPRIEADPEDGGLAARLTPGVLSLLTRWGATAGKGAIENERRASLRAQLVQAGYYSERAVEAYFGLRVALAVGLAPVGFLIGALLGLQGLLGFLAPIVAGANLGFMAPKLFVARRIAERRAAMQLGLPDAIDLVVVSIEAGATLTAALQRVVSDLRELHPVVSEQFGLMLTQIQAGASRAEALTRLAQRCPTDEVSSLTTMLIQSESVGASLGSTLRVFSEELRKSRFLLAERKAAELPVKLAFPLVLFIFPCLGLVIFVPVLIQVMRTLSQMHQ